MDQLLEATYKAETQHFWFRGFKWFVAPLLARSTEGITNPRILDCGCGTGANLDMLDTHGRSWGLELSWTGVAFAKKLHSRVVRGSVTHLPYPDRRFDVVTSFDVLYCLPDPEEALAVREMFRVLKPGGSVIINVAAMPILRGDHSVLGGEVRRYTRARLRRVLEDAGFRVTRITHTNASLFPIMLTLRLAQRLGGLGAPAHGGGEMAVPAAPVNSALSIVLALEALVLRVVDLPLGSSLLCLARKPG